jgi:excinuclease ABC subunit C
MTGQFVYKQFLKNLSAHPGIYQMIGKDQEILYVGKAQNLKKRVSSYFSRETKNSRISSLVKQITDIKVIITSSEKEALLLENNLIKKLRPRYNVLFRDDKSYPYIYLSNHKSYPRLDFYRGNRQESGNYFGPYPSATAVRESLGLLQKLFKIRQCSDNFFRNRTRPCIQYQINRCTAPCVSYITPEAYQQNVALAKLFLGGKNQELLAQLIKQMEQASAKLNFEEAARYRDQIANLRKVQERQYITSDGEDVDVIALARHGDTVCVQMLLFRAGRLIGNRDYFPTAHVLMPEEEIMDGFITQFYLSPNHLEDVPKMILINYLLSEKEWLESLLAETAGHKVVISKPERGDRVRWLDMATKNAENALANHIVNKKNFYERLTALQQSLQLETQPQRLECFDISHTQGEATVASCVVFNENGPDKKEYRRYNITGITKGDDYAAMRQVLTRRYSKIKTGEGILPDIIIIDGGKGQLHQAEVVLEELQITGVILLGIAKGPGRKPGLETIYLTGKERAIELLPEANALLLLQQIRDEAHRFAITGHKNRREKKRMVSPLEMIPGIGAERRRRLLYYFGGLQEIKRASIEELTKVVGISRGLAERIYENLHRD